MDATEYQLRREIASLNARLMKLARVVKLLVDKAVGDSKNAKEDATVDRMDDAFSNYRAGDSDGDYSDYEDE